MTDNHSDDVFTEGDPLMMSDGIMNILRSRHLPIALMSLIIALAVLGNVFLMTILSLYSFRRKRTRHDSGSSGKRMSSVHYLMINNCIADSAFALITMLPTLLQFVTAPYYYGGTTLCHVLGCLRVVPMYASPFLLVAISLDRYWAIVHPLRHISANARARARLMATFCWTLSVAVAMPNAFTHRYEEGDGWSTCHPVYGTNRLWALRAHVLFFMCLAWLFPSVLALVAYAHVCKRVWQQLTDLTHAIKFQEMRKVSMERINQLNNEQPIANGDNANGNAAPRSRENSLEPRRLSDACREQIRQLDRQKLDTVKLTMSIVGANFILWAPFCVANCIQVFWPEAIPPVFATYLMLLGNLNACVTPWIYVYYQHRQVSSIMLRCCKQQRPLGDGPIISIDPTIDDRIVSSTRRKTTLKYDPTNAIRMHPLLTNGAKHNSESKLLQVCNIDDTHLLKPPSTSMTINHCPHETPPKGRKGRKAATEQTPDLYAAATLARQRLSIC